ncbi:MAG: hypothetical protein Kow0069_12250 [Promethearchaeota archaeon]
MTVPAVEEYLVDYSDFGKLLVSLLENGFVDEVVGYQIRKDRFAVSAAKMGAKDKEALLQFPLSQLMVYNYARTDSAAKFLHKKMDGAFSSKTLLVGRPCDARALVELAKRFQVKLDNVFTIIVEDQGRMSTKQLTTFFKKAGVDLEKVARERVVDGHLVLYLDDGSTKEFPLGKGVDFAANCYRCFRKVPPLADLTVTDLGLPKESSKLILSAWSELGVDALRKSGLNLEALPASIKEAKEKVQAALVEAARERRAKDLAAFKEDPNRIPAFLTCTMCGMCINACPVCFCKDCILQKKRKEKAIDKVSYQLTRIAHVADSCVGCGLCSIVCPKNLPLSEIFQSINDDIAEDFEYVPGVSLEAEPPRSGKVIKDIALGGE